MPCNKLQYAIVVFIMASCTGTKQLSSIKKDNEQLRLTVNRLQQDSISTAIRLKQVQDQLAASFKANKNDNEALIKNPSTRDRDVSGTAKVASAPAMTKEEDLSGRALFIYNLCNNIHHKSYLKLKQYTIAVTGNYALFNKLEEYAAGKNIQQLPVKVVYVLTPADIAKPQAVVIGQQAIAKEATIRKKLKMSASLLFTTNNQQPADCNCVSVYPLGNKIHYNLNESTLKRNGFNINRTLLEMEN